MHYPKPALSVQDQIALLESRGLVIADKVAAEKILQVVSFQRLKSYFLSFYKRDADGRFTKEFIESTSFESVVRLYDFDFKLRLMLFDYTSKIEVALRTQLVNVYSIRYGSDWLLQHGLFDLNPIDAKTSRNAHDELLVEIKKDCHPNSDDAGIKHYYANFPSPYPDLPPAWMTLEVLSFGKLSKIYKSLKSSEEKRQVASYFNTLPIFLESWLAALSYMRNICAHHGMLWRRKLTKQPSLPTRRDKKLLMHSESIDVRDLFPLLSCLQYMMKSAGIKSDMREQLDILFSSYSDVDKLKMGFYVEWQNEPVWNN